MVTRSGSPRDGVVAPALLLSVFAALWWMERQRPLRPRTAPAGRRLAGNLATGALAALAVMAPTSPITQYAAKAVERNGLGLLPRVGLPPAAQRWAAVLLMDYTLYLWHVLLHRSPPLWCWHRHHHADPDLDVSTALRFHAAEMLWSLPWRLGQIQILILGVGPRALSLWSSLTIAEVMFHHANLRLPPTLERVLGRLVMTPARHGVHHSNAAAHQHTNYSSGLALWDWLHGTDGAAVPQQALVIGLPPEDAGTP